MNDEIQMLQNVKKTAASKIDYWKINLNNTDEKLDATAYRLWNDTNIPEVPEQQITTNISLLTIDTDLPGIIKLKMCV